jgi:prolyl-tRNA synthetase
MIARKPEDRERVLTWCRALASDLRAQSFDGAPVRVELDDRDIEAPTKLWSWIKKGVPLRLEIGPKDIEKDAAFVGRRDRAPKDKASVPRGELVATIGKTLQEMQDALHARALALREQHTRIIDSKDEFYAWFAQPKTARENDPTPIHGGFAMTHFDGDPALEAKIKDDLGVTVRCVPLADGEPGTCPFTGKPSAKRVVWAKAY